MCTLYSKNRPTAWCGASTHKTDTQRLTLENGSRNGGRKPEENLYFLLYIVYFYNGNVSVCCLCLKMKCEN